jgi:eukaryotic-like serine/threonine-protein kinase
MLARRRPFEGATLAEVQAGILREEPRELPAVDSRLSAALDRVVRRCLEKRAEDRFDTARDVALSLDAVAVASGEVPAVEAPARRRSPRRWAVLVAAGLFAAAALGAALRGYLRPAPGPPSYTQLTFRRGTIGSARFAPDGQTVVYAAAWDGEPMRLFATRLGSRESRDLGIEGGLLDISSSGEMAVRLGGPGGPARDGTLARVSLSGGAPRELLDAVVDAAWDAAGRDLAVVHRVDGRTRLEYPIGHVVYQPAGEIQAVCPLPGGTLAVHEQLPDGGARPFAITLIDPTRGRRVLSAGWAELWRPVWSSPTGEIFFAGIAGAEFALQAVSLAGATRLVARVPGDFQLKDVDSRGRILLARSFPRGGVVVLRSGTAQERDLSWLDFSYVADLSADGRQLLLGDIGGGLVGKGGIALRRTDGSPAVLLGEGSALSLSPDGRFVLALPDVLGPGDRLLVIATGAGDRRELRHPSIPRFVNAAWFPDGRHIAVVGGAGPNRMRLHVWDVDGQDAPRPLSPEGEFGQPVVAPDGRFVTVAQNGKPPALYTVDGGPPRALPGSRDDDQPLRWTADGRSLFVRRGKGLPARIDRVEITTGRRQVWKELRPADPAGVFSIGNVVVTPDGAGYAYTFSSSIGSLYLAEGIR